METKFKTKNYGSDFINQILRSKYLRMYFIEILFAKHSVNI